MMMNNIIMLRFSLTNIYMQNGIIIITYNYVWVLSIYYKFKFNKKKFMRGGANKNSGGCNRHILSPIIRL